MSRLCCLPVCLGGGSCGRHKRYEDTPRVSAPCMHGVRPTFDLDELDKQTHCSAGLTSRFIAFRSVGARTQPGGAGIQSVQIIHTNALAIYSQGFSPRKPWNKNCTLARDHTGSMQSLKHKDQFRIPRDAWSNENQHTLGSSRNLTSCACAKYYWNPLLEGQGWCKCCWT